VERRQLREIIERVRSERMLASAVFQKENEFSEKMKK